MYLIVNGAAFWSKGFNKLIPFLQRLGNRLYL